MKLLLKKEYFSSLVSSASDNPKRLWQTVNKLLHRKSSSPLHTTSPGTSLADSFASFFTGKISKLRLSLTSHPATSSPPSPSPPATPPNFSVFTPASEPEVYKILSSCPNKLSTFPSSPASFTPLSRNPLSHHCLRNQHWIKKNSRTIGQSHLSTHISNAVRRHLELNGYKLPFVSFIRHRRIEF